MLIATGIGVTPFASILQSIMHRYWKARHCCPNCKHTWVSEIPPTIMHLRKVSKKYVVLRKIRLNLPGVWRWLRIARPSGKALRDLARNI